MPNYTGTQDHLTGIPSLILQGLQNITDQTTQTALYQVQQWANSFFPWQYGSPTGNYTTGGVQILFDNPYSTGVFAITFGVFDTGGASQASIVTIGPAGFKVQLFTPTGTELANGTAFEFSYMAIGH